MMVAMSNQQLFAHLLLHFGTLLAYFLKPEPFNLSYAPITFDGRWLRTNGLARAMAQSEAIAQA